MTVAGTEAEIILIVTRLGKATKNQISKKVGFSLDYTEYLCRYLTRKGYLTCSEGYYSLANKENEKPAKKITEIDKNLIKDIASEIAGEIRKELNQAVSGINISNTSIERKGTQDTQDKVRIRTDFEFPVEDESINLESNIKKIGVTTEKQESDIGKNVELLRNLIKGAKKDGRNKNE